MSNPQHTPDIRKLRAAIIAHSKTERRNGETFYVGCQCAKCQSARAAIAKAGGAA